MDGVDDFNFTYLKVESHGGKGFFVRVETLTPEAKINTPLNIESPDTLDYNDSLQFNSSWTNEEITMYSYSRHDAPGNGPGTPVERGIWKDVENKYVGLMLEKDTNPVYGWAKATVGNDNTQIFIIHEVAYKQGVY